MLRPGGTVTIVDFGGHGYLTEAGHEHNHGHGPHHGHHHGRRWRRKAGHEKTANNAGDVLVELLSGAGFADAGELGHIDRSFGRVSIVQARA
ncbi:hypothetical protein [Saccharomonospora sp. CUA-673]|uniref:hypothetical protein n=1 Tax=Saccharomonospora sp. CUA-673 TaxID=1904969 RepID=UPI00210179B1|nr:hypothetical protein [Saccharomonospora sp. CUA-673]